MGALSLLSSVVAFCGVVSDRELLPELVLGADRVSSLVAMTTLHVGRTTHPFVMQYYDVISAIILPIMLVLCSML